MTEQSEAQRRAATRKAKILARGNAGLNKLAQTARGGEADMLYGSDLKPSSSTLDDKTKPKETSSASQSSSSARPSSHTQPQTQLPSEQQAMAKQLEAMMSMFGSPNTQAGPGGEMPDIGRLLADMMSDSSLETKPAINGQETLGNLDDPAGFGGMGPEGIPPQFPGGAGDLPFRFTDLNARIQKRESKSKVEKYFPLMHFIAMVALAVFTVVWWEPALEDAAPLRQGTSWSERWNGFAGRRIKGLGQVEVLPVFWAFLTVELILQTTRLMVLKSPPEPHSYLQNFLPILPPNISRPLLTGSRYLSLVSQTYKDGCLLVFVLGMTVVVAGWLRESTS
ncbi:uncharacterized protein L203_104011 [Cryptococcus depauperatus CBS 7841]|uniref:Uncharacterized protein n=1 Tax=Cryptococcus depauperatus CBS 7841 TaxID=1295531 RepID=A0A1E3IE59_9TREE|nr:hypothetical protein L203_04542 [Cryptococcus depauperatus CBS 7841]